MLVVSGTSPVRSTSTINCPRFNIKFPFYYLNQRCTYV